MDTCTHAHWNTWFEKQAHTQKKPLLYDFPVCWSWIRLCCAAHPEGEVDIWAGGGVEGEKVLVRCTLGLGWCAQPANRRLLNKWERGPIIMWHLSESLCVTTWRPRILKIELIKTTILECNCKYVHYYGDSFDLVCVCLGAVLWTLERFVWTKDRSLLPSSGFGGVSWENFLDQFAKLTSR